MTPLPNVIWSNGMTARVHRAAWTAGGQFHLLSITGSRPAMTVITAALLKTPPAYGEIHEVRDGAAQNKYVGTVHRTTVHGDQKITYRRIIEPTTVSGVSQALIWSSSTEERDEGIRPVAFGRTRAELRESFYRRLNSRTVVPMREAWVRTIMAQMIEDGVAQRMTTVGGHAVMIDPVPDNYISDLVAEILEGD